MEPWDGDQERRLSVAERGGGGRAGEWQLRFPTPPPFLHREAVTLGAPVRVGFCAFFLGFAVLSRARPRPL